MVRSAGGDMMNSAPTAWRPPSTGKEETDGRERREDDADDHFNAAKVGVVPETRSRTVSRGEPWLLSQLDRVPSSRVSVVS